MDMHTQAAAFIAAAREQYKEMSADPMESPAEIARYLDHVLMSLQTDFDLQDPRLEVWCSGIVTPPLVKRTPGLR